MLFTLTDVFDVYPAYLSTGSVFSFFFFRGGARLKWSAISRAIKKALCFIVGQAKEF